MGSAPRRGRVDAVAVLTVFALLLTLLPARLVVGPLGGVGAPATLVGLLAAWWWLVARLHPESGLERGPQPVRYALFVHLGYMALSYALAFARPLTDLEITGSSRRLIMFAALTGVALLVADGVASRNRLDTLLRRVTACITVVAAIGIVQFATGFDPVQYIRLPGLTFIRETYGIGSRSLFNRPFSTTLHPIEFGVVLAIMLPLALHYAFHAPRGRVRTVAWIQVALIATGVPLAIGRSGIVGIITAVVVLSIAWTWRRRLNALVVSAGFTLVMWATVPGLVGTLRNLFVKADDDPSVQARIERVPTVLELVSESPVLGRGVGTFSVDDYFLVDNQYYVSAIEVGILGLIVVLGLFAWTMVAAYGVHRRSRDPVTRHLAMALIAGLAAVVVSIYTFDAFFYRIFTGLMFLLIGAVGALWRLETAAAGTAEREVSSSSVTRMGAALDGGGPPSRPRR